MKIKKTISLFMIVAITVISFSSCTVEYRSRHHRHYDHDYNYAPAVNDKQQTVSVQPVSSSKISVTH